MGSARLLFRAASGSLWHEAPFVHSRGLVLCFHRAAFWTHWLKIHPATLCYGVLNRPLTWLRNKGPRDISRPLTPEHIVRWLYGVNAWLRADFVYGLLLWQIFLTTTAHGEQEQTLGGELTISRKAVCCFLNVRVACILTCVPQTASRI